MEMTSPRHHRRVPREHAGIALESIPQAESDALSMDARIRHELKLTANATTLSTAFHAKDAVWNMSVKQNDVYRTACLNTSEPSPLRTSSSQWEHTTPNPTVTPDWTMWKYSSWSFWELLEPMRFDPNVRGSKRNGLTVCEHTSRWDSILRTKSGAVPKLRHVTFLILSVEVQPHFHNADTPETA